MRAAERGGVVVRLARRVIAWLLPAGDRVLLEELDEVWGERLAARGRWSADAWYVRQASGFVARLAMGRAREEVRATAAGASVRDAVRSLKRRPGWALGVMATLGVGVGGVASVYAVANWVVLRPVPGVGAGEEVVVLRLGSSEAPPHVTWRVSERDYRGFREQLTMLRDLAAASPVDVHARIGGRAERLSGEVVTPNYFEVLGARLVAGPGFGDGESAQDAIVSDALAREVAGDPRAAVGEMVRVNGRRFRVVGVTPPGFRGAELPGRAEVWFTLASLPLLDPGTPVNVAGRGGWGVWRRMYGRMHPGETAERVQLAANAAMRRIGTSGEATVFVVSHFRMLADAGVGPDPGIRASLRETLTLLGGASACLLLLAIANVANLSAMDATGRQGMLAIRFALGAARRTLVSQWVVEAVLLGVAGAAAALAVALALNGAFRSLRLDAFGAPLHELRVDVRVLLFTVLAGLAASLVAGLPVAMSARRVRALSVLGRARHGGASGSRVRSTFVVVQVATSVVLVAGAGLMGRTVANLRAVDLGFELGDLLVFSIDPAADGRGGAEGLALLARLESGLAAHTAVGEAGFVVPAPLSGSYLTAAVYPDGGTQEEDRLSGLARLNVTRGFLRVLGVSAPADLRGNDAIITANLASRAYPQMAPSATEGLLLHRPQHSNGGEPPLRIAGVTRDMHLHGLPDQAPPTIFLPFDTAAFRFGVVTGWVRPSGGRADAVRAIHEVVAANAPDLPVFDLMPGRAAVDRISAQRVALARVALLLGMLGLMLAAVGLYALLGRGVAERLREFGVRAALGATGGRLLRDVALHGIRLGTAGCIIGLGGALAASRTLRARLFEVDALDPLTHAGAVVLVLGFAVLASVVPAVRAMRVSPLTAMRNEL